MFRFLIGAVAILFVVFQVGRARGWIKPSVRPLGPRVGAVTGVTAGFTSFVSHAGGPPVAIYLLSRGLDKLSYQSTTVLIFAAINALKFVPYAGLGIFTRDTLMAGLYLAPFAVLGTWVGVRAHHLLPDRYYFLLTYVMLVLTGAKLIFDALT